MLSASSDHTKVGRSIAIASRRERGALDMNVKATPKFRPAERIANSFADMLELKVRDREIISSILRSTLVHNPDYIGVWNVWEPDALDGCDNLYRDTEGHDKTGRMINYWQRRGNDICLGPVTKYDEGAGPDWYRVPQKTQKMQVAGPYRYPVAGAKIVIMSQVAPILHDGKFLGVVGIDISMELWAEEALSGGRLTSSDIIDDTLAQGCVLLDGSESVVHWTSHAKNLLERYCGFSGSLPTKLPESLIHRRANRPAMPVAESAMQSSISIRRVALPVPRHSLLLVSEEGKEEGQTPPLTPREREVRHWLSQGKSNDEIAVILGISPHTVKNHLNHLFDKLGVSNRYAAALADSN